MRKLIRKFGYWLINNTDQLLTDSTYSKSKHAHPVSVASTMRSSNIGESIHGMNFTVYPATGGKVIQFVAYDPLRDRTSASLYVITDKGDLGDELGQIITKESLSR